MKYAARMGDLGSHAPPQICGSSGSINVRIGGQGAWRGVPAGTGSSISANKSASNKLIKAKELLVKFAPNPVAKKAAEEELKMTKKMEQMQMASLITGAAGMADIHFCSQIFTVVLFVPIPHGPGVVINGSKSVFINGLPACRKGDTIIEAGGGSNTIQMGYPSVIIGG